MLTEEERYSGKMLSDDRILVLKPIEGAKVLNGAGAPDPRLFKGENNLHIFIKPQTSLWRFRYDVGGLPEPLKQTFTKYNQAYKCAEDYFKRRGVEIVEVINA